MIDFRIYRDATYDFPDHYAHEYSKRRSNLFLCSFAGSRDKLLNFCWRQLNVVLMEVSPCIEIRNARNFGQRHCLVCALEECTFSDKEVEIGELGKITFDRCNLTKHLAVRGPRPFAVHDGLAENTDAAPSCVRLVFQDSESRAAQGQVRAELAKRMVEAHPYIKMSSCFYRMGVNANC